MANIRGQAFAIRDRIPVGSLVMVPMETALWPSGLHTFPGADFTKGLKSSFRLKFKTLVLNFINRMLSLWS